MPHALRRTCSSLLTIAALSWLPSCGFGTAGVALGMGGGGGGGSTAEVKIIGLTRDSNISGVAPKPGQLVAADLVDSTVSFAGDGVYAASWRNSAGEVVAAASVRGMTSRRLAVVVPLGLSAGDYKVEFALGDGRAELSVPVGAAGAVTDPVAVVDAAKAWWVSQRDVVQATANADTDAERKARSLADLARLSGWLTTFDGAVASLDAASLRTLAELLQANSDLRAAEPSEPYVSVDLIAAQSAAAAVLADSGLTALAASSSVVAPRGSAAVLESLLPASQQISGLVAVLTAYDRWTKALARPCKPIEGTLQVTALDGSPLTLRFTSPLPLRCRVSCSSLTAADVVDDRVRDIATRLVAVAVRQGALLPSSASLVQSREPQAASVPVVDFADLAPSRLELVSQTSVAGQPPLIVEAGALRADEAVIQSSSKLVELRIRERFLVQQVEQEGSLGLASGSFGVALDNSPPSDLDLVLIQPGTFQMGSIAVGGVAVPVHGVTITRPFWMGKFEVTQARFLALRGFNPSDFPGATLPVNRVTWIQAVEYCDALTQQEAAAGRLPVGYEYRLPTEAEWEYCCRAGTTTEWSFGSSPSCDHANAASCLQQPSIVGSYAANAFGVHDMHGNVWEWCLDSTGSTGDADYPTGSVSDPYMTVGILRRFRGGSFDFDALSCRSAFRLAGSPGLLNFNIGFRVVCAPIL